MLKFGDYNTLRAVREVEFGVYLDAGEGREILLPRKYVPAEGLNPGDEIEVFVYNDSADRPIATTEKPFARVGEFAYLQVSQVNKVGAFLDWGIPGKDLLVPFSQQRAPMHTGGIYLVYVYLDDASHRIAATAKVDKYLGNTIPDYRHGQAVDCLVIEKTPIGYKCIVDNLHRGMIYLNETFRPVELEEHTTAYVKRVRDDGKIDLTLSDRRGSRIDELSERVFRAIEQAGGRMAVTDSSSPEEIKALFNCSKKDYKRALGHLYKLHRILITPEGVTLSDCGDIKD